MRIGNQGSFSEKGLGESTLRITQQTVDLVEGIRKDVERKCGEIEGLGKVLWTYTQRLELTSLELAAWDCLLLVTMKQRDGVQAQLEYVAVTAYHAKEIFTRTATPLSDRESPAICAKLRSWQATAPTVSLEEISRQFKKLSVHTSADFASCNVSEVVNGIVEARYEANQEDDNEEFPLSTERVPMECSELQESLDCDHEKMQIEAEEVFF